MLYKTGVALSVILVLAGTAWIFAGDRTASYLAYSALALLAFGLRLGDGSTMGFAFIVVTLPYLTWQESLLIGSSAIFIHAVSQRLKQTPQELLRTLSITALAILTTHGVVQVFALPQIHPVMRIMMGACVCFAVLHLGKWKKSNLWSFPFYPLAAGAACLLPITFVLAPLLLLAWWTYRLYEKRLAEQRDDLTRACNLHMRTIETLALAIEAKDKPQVGHSGRVPIFAVEMAKELNMSAEDIDAMRTASILYDIGELAVPEHIILKPGKLTAEEYEKVKIHTQVGADILERVRFPYPVAPIVLAHHERWDGNGYPHGLKGAEIPLGARILAAVDALDALASPRYHRTALRIEKALEVIVSESGRAFDPQVVALLCKRYRDWDRLAAEVPARDFMHSIFAAQREATLLFDLNRKLGSSLDLTETFAALRPALRELVEVDAFAVWTERDGFLAAEYAQGVHLALLSSLRIPAGSGISGRTAASGKCMLNGDASLELEHAGGAKSLTPFSVALSVPLKEANFTGALTLYRTNSTMFSPEDARRVQMLAPKLAVAVAKGLKYRRATDDALTDGLTGLPNAAALAARLKQCPSSVVVCDLNGFKAVNDRFGHLVGNRLLIALADGFRKSCREGDFIARLGGDEFVLLPDTISPAEIGPRLAQFREMVRAAGRQVCEGEAVLDASFGAAFYPQDGKTADELLAFADQRMYRRKSEMKAGILVLERRVNAG